MLSLMRTFFFSSSVRFGQFRFRRDSALGPRKVHCLPSGFSLEKPLSDTLIVLKVSCLRFSRARLVALPQGNPSLFPWGEVLNTPFRNPISNPIYVLPSVNGLPSLSLSVGASFSSSLSAALSLSLYSHPPSLFLSLTDSLILCYLICYCTSCLC